MPLLLFYFFIDDFPFWTVLALFFTNTAFVTIGGSNGYSLGSAGCDIKAALADQTPNDGRFRTGRNNSRASHHSGGISPGNQSLTRCAFVGTNPTGELITSGLLVT